MIIRIIQVIQIGRKMQIGYKMNLAKVLAGTKEKIEKIQEPDGSQFEPLNQLVGNRIKVNSGLGYLQVGQNGVN